jgi:hypothetical protein
VSPLSLGVALLGLGGLGSACDRVLGLDEVHGRPDATLGVDGGPPRTRLSVHSKLVRFRAQLEYSERPAEDMLATTRWLLPDDDEPSGLRALPAALGPDNTLEVFVDPDAPRAMLAYQDLSGVPAYLDIAARHVELLFGAWGAADATPAGDDATVKLQMSLPTPFAVGESMQYNVIGPFVSRTFPAEPDFGVVAFAPDAFAPSSLTPVVGTPTLFGEDDVLVVSRYVTSGYTALSDAYQLTGATQDSVSKTFVAGNLSAVARNQAFTLHGRRADGLARLDALVPAFVSIGEGWNVVSSPLHEFNNIGMTLASGAAVPVEGLLVSFGNPFTWSVVVTHHLNKGRVVDPVAAPALPGPVTIYTGFITYAAPPPGVGALVDVTRPQALPLGVVMADVLVAQDGQAVMLPPGQGPIELDLQLDAGACDLYGAVLTEFVDTGGAAVRTTRAVVRGDQTSLRLPREHLTPGGVYTIRSECFLGAWPEIADGDLATRGLPYHYGYQDSPLFAVQAR